MGGESSGALLATRCSYLQATFWAATVGKVLAVLGAVWFGLVAKNPVAVGLFLFIMVAGDIRVSRRQTPGAQEAQWKHSSGISTRPTEAGDGAPVDFLHGQIAKSGPPRDTGRIDGAQVTGFDLGAKRILSTVAGCSGALAGSRAPAARQPPRRPTFNPEDLMSDTIAFRLKRSTCPVER